MNYKAQRIHDRLLSETRRTKNHGACCGINETDSTNPTKILILQGDRLDSREQSCLASCQDRYLEARAHVEDALQKRQG